MNFIRRIFGELTYYILWPLFYFYLKSSHRTRLIVEADGSLLLVENLFGKREWGLPGGGLHKNEDPLEGVIRELREETGLVVPPGDVKTIFQNRLTRDRRFTYYIDCFEVSLKEQVKLNPQTFEISRAEWVKMADIIDKYKLQPTVKPILEAWLDR